MRFYKVLKITFIVLLANTFSHASEDNDLFSINNGLPFTLIYNAEENICKPKQFDIKESLKNNFLEFTKNWNCKRIAYAISFGLDKLNYSDEK